MFAVFSIGALGTLKAARGFALDDALPGARLTLLTAVRKGHLGEDDEGKKQNMTDLKLSADHTVIKRVFNKSLIIYMIE